MCRDRGKERERRERNKEKRKDRGSYIYKEYINI